MSTPDSGAAPDQEGIEGRQVEPALSRVAADETACPHCGHDPADLDVLALEALTAAKNSIIRRQAHIDGYMAAFEERWEASKPPSWRRSLRGLVNAGLPRSAMLDAAEIALDADHVADRKTFAYFMGIAWRKAREIEGDALERILRESP